VIRIDVHSVGENMTNTTRMLPTPVNVCSAYTFCGQSSYVATFHESLTELNRVTAPEKKGLLTQFTARRLTDPQVRTQFLSRDNQWSSGESHASINNGLLGLPGPYHWHAIGTFNTCSRGPIERSLTDTGGGYNLEGVDFPRTTPQPFQPAASPFP
jgi:hypothetical protein